MRKATSSSFRSSVPSTINEESEEDAQMRRGPKPKHISFSEVPATITPRHSAVYEDGYEYSDSDDSPESDDSYSDHSQSVSTQGQKQGASKYKDGDDSLSEESDFNESGDQKSEITEQYTKSTATQTNQSSKAMSQRPQDTSMRWSYPDPRHQRGSQDIHRAKTYAGHHRRTHSQSQGRSSSQSHRSKLPATSSIVAEELREQTQEKAHNHSKPSQTRHSYPEDFSTHRRAHSYQGLPPGIPIAPRGYYQRPFGLSYSQTYGPPLRHHRRGRSDQVYPPFQRRSPQPQTSPYLPQYYYPPPQYPFVPQQYPSYPGFVERPHPPAANPGLSQPIGPKAVLPIVSPQAAQPLGPHYHFHYYSPHENKASLVPGIPGFSRVAPLFSQPYQQVPPGATVPTATGGARATNKPLPILRKPHAGVSHSQSPSVAQKAAHKQASASHRVPNLDTRQHASHTNHNKKLDTNLNKAVASSDSFSPPNPSYPSPTPSSSSTFSYSTIYSSSSIGSADSQFLSNSPLSSDHSYSDSDSDSDQDSSIPDSVLAIQEPPRPSVKIGPTTTLEDYPISDQSFPGMFLF